MTEPAGWRLIVDSAARGAWNMALDEAILDRYASAEAPRAPTLRLYGFHPASLSLGRLQDAAASCDPRFLRRAGVDLVRRPTGGNAVLHDVERTYAVVGPLRAAPFDGGVVETYRRIADCLVDALRTLGADVRIGPAAPREPRVLRLAEPSCFSLLSSHEITHRGRKLVGSAQLRRRGAFVQHGSIPLHVDPAAWSGALGSPVSPEGFTDLERAVGAPVAPEALDAAIVRAFEERFATSLVPGAPSETELRRATLLYAWKYCSAAWTRDGKLGVRETARVPL